MSAGSDHTGSSSDTSRRTLVKSVGAGLASLSLLGAAGTVVRREPGSVPDDADGTDRAAGATVETTITFESTPITTSETTTIICEWDIDYRIAPGGFHTLVLFVQSANIDSPETTTEPFRPDNAWVYGITSESVPIRGSTYRWSVRDRWTTPGRYRVEADISPYFPGEITALAGPYGGEYLGWAKTTLSVEW